MHAKKARPAPHPRARKHVPVSTQNAVVVHTDSTSGGAGARLLQILLLIVPLLLLIAAAAPARAVPNRFALAWVRHRVELGVLAGSLLLVDAVLYVLSG